MHDPRGASPAEPVAPEFIQDPALAAAAENGAAMARAGGPLAGNPYPAPGEYWRAWRRGFLRVRMEVMPHA